METTIEDYIEYEIKEVESLESNLNVLENKWFKYSKTIQRIEFLKNYIKLKKKLVQDLDKFIIKE